MHHGSRAGDHDPQLDVPQLRDDGHLARPRRLVGPAAVRQRGAREQRVRALDERLRLALLRPGVVRRQVRERARGQQHVRERGPHGGPARRLGPVLGRVGEQHRRRLGVPAGRDLRATTSARPATAPTRPSTRPARAARRRATRCARCPSAGSTRRALRLLASGQLTGHQRGSAQYAPATDQRGLRARLAARRRRLRVRRGAAARRSRPERARARALAGRCAPPRLRPARHLPPARGAAARPRPSCGCGSGARRRSPCGSQRLRKGEHAQARPAPWRCARSRLHKAVRGSAPAGLAAGRYRVHRAAAPTRPAHGSAPDAAAAAGRARSSGRRAAAWRRAAAARAGPRRAAGSGTAARAGRAAPK